MLSNHDCLSGKGRRLYFNALGTLREKGLYWLGTQCSSFVVLCRSVTQRSAVNQYYGDVTKRCVSEGNSMRSLCLVVFMSWITLCRPVIEQPLNSCLPDLPAMRHMFSWIKASRTVIFLGACNGPSCKPLQLWPTSAGCTSLHRCRPDMVGAEPLVVRGASGQFTGCVPCAVAFLAWKRLGT